MGEYTRQGELDVSHPPRREDHRGDGATSTDMRKGRGNVGGG